MNLVVASQFLVYMFIGVAFHHLHERTVRPGRGAALIVLLFALFAAMLRFGPDAQGATLLPSYLGGLLAFGLGYALRDRFRPTRIGGFLADVSYPLYVSHGVAGYVCMRWLLEAGAGVAATLATTTVLSLLLAWALHRVVEEPSHAVASRLSRRRVERMDVKCC